MDKRSLSSVWDWIALGVGFAVMAVGVVWAEQLPAWFAYLWPPLVLLGLVGAVRMLWRVMGMGRAEQVHPPATTISDETWALLLAEKEKTDKAQESPEESEEASQ